MAGAVAARAAARLAAADGPPDPAGVVLAPVQPYGASGEHEGFPGTVSLGQAALELLVVELGRSLLRWARRLLVVNGHGGNVEALSRAVALLRYEGRDAAWWPCVPPGSDAHAGRAETSMMLRLRPEAVRTGRAAAGCTDPIERLLPRLRASSVRTVSPSGVLGDPAGAHAAEGERLLAGMAGRLAADAAGWRVGEDGRLGAAVPEAAR